MKVADVMSRATVAESDGDSLRQAAILMWEKQTGSLLVMSGPRLLGIITERDVMKAAARGLDLDTTPISAVMTTSLLTVSPETSLHEAAGYMSQRWIRHLPVIVDGRVAGMVSQRDLCGAFADLAPGE
jgi:CBS domain-containing protein